MLKITYTELSKPLLTIEDTKPLLISELLHLTIVNMIKGRNGLVTERLTHTSEPVSWEYNDSIIDFIVMQLIERDV